MKVRTHKRTDRASLIIGGIMNTSLGFGFSKPIIPRATATLVNDSIKATARLKSRRISPRRIPSQFLANSAQTAFKKVKANV